MPAYGVVFRTTFPENTKRLKDKQLEPDSGDGGEAKSCTPTRERPRLETPA